MTKQEILAKVDHTLLKADAGWEDIRRICDEALENSTASICINPCWVERAVEYLGGRVPVCTVIGFPLGATTTAAKVAEAKQALAEGCEEFDMVINIGWVKDKKFAQIEEEIEQYRENTLPAIIQIPGVSGNTGAGVNGVKKTVEQAVGSDILFGGVSE